MQEAIDANVAVHDTAAAGIEFDAFYAAEYESMVRLAVGLVDQRARAEELVQDAFERVLLRWHRVDQPGAYLRQSVVNAARSELRRRRLSRRHPSPEAAAAAAQDGQPSPIDQQLLAALHRLTPQRRIAVVLRFVADCSEAQTAALMGCRPGTVKSLVSRGVADLRKEFVP